MTERTFYERALLLPVGCTIAAWAVIYADKGSGDVSRFPESLFTGALLLGYGGLWGAIPYAIVAVVVLRLLRQPNHPGMSYTRLLVLAPIGVVLVAYLLMVLVSIAKRNITVLGAAYLFTAWAIVIGYGYVVVIWAALKIARRYNWVTGREQTDLRVEM